MTQDFSELILPTSDGHEVLIVACVSCLCFNLLYDLLEYIDRSFSE